MTWNFSNIVFSSLIFKWIKELERWCDISSEVNQQTEHTKNFSSFGLVIFGLLLQMVQSQLDMQIWILKICIFIAMFLFIDLAIIFWWPVRFWIGSLCMKSKKLSQKMEHAFLCMQIWTCNSRSLCPYGLYVWLAYGTWYVSAIYIHAYFTYTPTAWIARLFKSWRRRRGGIAGAIMYLISGMQNLLSAMANSSLQAETTKTKCFS